MLRRGSPAACRSFQRYNRDERRRVERLGRVARVDALHAGARRGSRLWRRIAGRHQSLL